MAVTTKTITAGGSHEGLLTMPGSSETLQLQGTLKLTVGAVTANGGNLAQAAALPYHVNLVSGADSTKGVVLPSAAAGTVCVVHNDGAAHLVLYPNTGDDINGGTANAGVNLEGNTMAIAIAMDTGTWGVIYTANS
jgi:hypothetical protein